ncbi:hypothetical protein CPS_3767 [Colwellia psychrerythraea 34H]|uniref:Uncharacterized protein n=1 Tax=Colwellia psychrerythraea (strain 34H / ATCC BAA-681) TaxID=167879 RepID=Q47XN6_COLP3|nr:hypothetical protein CPS_3767 [Colwellia psychrerythraea 34H]
MNTVTKQKFNSLTPQRKGVNDKNYYIKTITTSLKKKGK